MMVISPQAPYKRTRLEMLGLDRNDVNASTVVSDPGDTVHIWGANQDGWMLHFFAKGEGDSDDEARRYLRDVSMRLASGQLTMRSSGPSGLTGGHGDLIADAPADATVTDHASIGALEVRSMAGPVQVTATTRATILSTTGRVDAQGEVVDFAGSEGKVTLDAEEINFKLTAARFNGTVSAVAQRQLCVMIPRGFQTPLQVVVSRPKNFVCRAEFCARFKRKRDGAFYLFSYAGSGDTPSEQAGLRSNQSTVEIDNTN
jgi:hypothetical protein